MGMIVDLMKIFMVKYIQFKDIFVLFSIMVNMFMKYLNNNMINFDIQRICLLVVLGLMQVWQILYVQSEENVISFDDFVDVIVLYLWIKLYMLEYFLCKINMKGCYDEE